MLSVRVVNIWLFPFGNVVVDYLDNSHYKSLSVKLQGKVFRFKGKYRGLEAELVD